MSSPTNQAFPDEIAELIASYVVGVSKDLDARTGRAAKCVLIDAMAVSVGALRHPAAQKARQHAYRFADTAGGALIWGTKQRTSPELAALTNGVLLRCYDYNDFMVGNRNSGHPSDMVGGVIAAAEWSGASGAELLSALAVGYELVGAAFDAFSTAPGGWDYTNLTAIGATAAIATVLKLDESQTREALAMTVVPHFASDEIESGELNARGDLTMWKRFNGSDAVRNALQACLLASVGVEGAIRPFVGKCGFVKKMQNKWDPLEVLREVLVAERPLARVGQAMMKRWPVGSVGQSAIQATLDARAQVGDIDRIKEIRVFAEEGAYEHLVQIRTAPWEPISRETADHSLPYIVATAAMDGYVHVDSFNLGKVLDPARRKFLKDKVKVSPAPELGTLAGGKHARAAAGYLSRVEFETLDGQVIHGAARPFPGHPDNPFSDSDLLAKLSENAAPLIGKSHAQRLGEALLSLERMPDLTSLMELLEFDAPAQVDVQLAAE
ncbi:MAG: 2-methylcitrate dehydratase [Gammaproteobacteria bacterium]|nr:2-methylcitrate dehydratase [Gammaproteobacteria bacterium]